MRLFRRGGYQPEFVVAAFFLIVALFFYGSLAWTTLISFTGSRLLPDYTLVGFSQYLRLMATPRWQTACINLLIFGILYVGFSLVLGTILAVLLDQKVRCEGVLRTIFLYPLAISLIVTGLSWRWILDPVTGLQNLIRQMGWSSFTFDWLVNPDKAIYTLVIAGLWHSIGFVMVIMLAGLRGVDTDLWKAIRVEGIPKWRAYLHIIVPSLRPMVASCVVLLSSEVIRGYDLVIGLTKGGPGVSSDLPAKFAVDYFFGRANIGLASAASVVMMLIVLVLLAPYFYSEFRRKI